MPRKFILILAATLALGTPALPARASFLGRPFYPAYDFPGPDSAYDGTGWAQMGPPLLVVGPGVEGSTLIEEIVQLSVDFSATSLTLLLHRAGPDHPFSGALQPGLVWRQARFNGPAFFFPPVPGPELTGLAVDEAGTTLAGFDNARLYFDEDEIRLNWAGLAFEDGTRVTVNLAFAGTPVPEPTPLALLGTGLLGFALVRRATRG